MQQSQKKQKRRLVINFNHISKRLSKDKINELKAYYMSYHKKMWMYKSAYKRLKKWKLAGNIASIVFATGGIASTIATSETSLLAISSVSILIQAYMEHKDVAIKLYQCQYAFKTYGHLLNEIKEIMRIGNFDTDELTGKLTLNDDFILDNSPIVDKWGDMYDNKYQIFTYV